MVLKFTHIQHGEEWIWAVDTVAWIKWQLWCALGSSPGKSLWKETVKMVKSWDVMSDRRWEIEWHERKKRWWLQLSEGPWWLSERVGIEENELIYFLSVGVGTSSSSLWNLMGNAMVMTQYIRLTPDMQSKQGALWNRVVRIFLPPVWLTQKVLKSSPVAYWLNFTVYPSILSSVDIKDFHFRDYRDLHNEIRYLGRCSVALSIADNQFWFYFLKIEK